MKYINKVEDKFLILKNKKINIYMLSMIIILIIGILIRIIGITEMPNALNCDEASAGYEAFSIINYGIDRNRK